MIDPHSQTRPSAGGGRPLSISILAIVLIYAFFASLWILLSDRAVAALFTDPARIVLVSTLKGWLFVGVTSILLYGLMRRFLPGRSDTLLLPTGRLRLFALPLTLLVLIIIALTAGGLAHTLQVEKDKEVARLQAIADLKTHQIADWLKERRNDALFVQSSPQWFELYRTWRHTGDTASRDQLKSRLVQFVKGNGFEGVLLLDEAAEPLWDSSGAIPAIDPSLRAVARQAAIDKQIHLLDPSLDPSGHLHLDFVAPLPGVDDQPGPVAVLYVDPTIYLFPTLQSWPVPSPSGETLLFKRDGDRILFLNELRHRANTALKFRLPLTEKRLLAAQVVQGEVKLGSLVEGVDYRGVPVIGVVRGVPGTDWFLVAKLDQAEVYSEAAGDLLWIVLAGLLTMFMAAAAAYLIRQRQELLLSQREHQVQTEKLHVLQLFNAIVEGSPDAIYVKDILGRYLLLNREAIRLIGKSEAELLGRDDTALFPPEQAASLMALDRQVMAEDRSATFQEVLATTEGVRTFQSFKGTIHDPEGKVNGMFGISRDITERRLAEEALQESEETYRSLFMNMLNGFAYCRMVYENGQPMDFVYLSVNEAFTRLTGLQDVIGRKISEVVPGIRETDPEIFEIYGRVATSGQAERFEIFVEAMQMWFAISVYSPKTEHFVAVFDVINERKQAEAALRESEGRFRSLFEHSPVAYQSLDQEGRFIDTNPVLCELLGYEREELLGRRFDEFWPEESRDNFPDSFAAFKQDKQIRTELQLVCKDGTEISVLLVGRAEQDRNGEFVKTHCILADITERKQGEEERAKLQAQLLQAQKMESVGRLAGGVAHDFNNMLSVIIGHSELALIRNDLPEGLSGGLEEIKKAAERSADLTRQLLAFARKQAIAPQVLDLNDTTTGMLKLLRRLIGENIDLVWIPGAELWPVMIDPAQIDQILANLAVNARDAIAGVGQLTIETRNVILDQAYCASHADSVPGEYVMLAVGDNGSGMEKEIVGHIFEPFFTTKGVGMGTGLGLATVYGVVKQNEGTIDVVSEPGQGTTFKIYLPRFTGEIVNPAAALREETPLGNGEKLLVVEDEETIREMCLSMLTSLGYSVVTAATPGEAVDLVESGAEVELLITDVVMPEMNGRDLARQLCALKPGLKCLFMSGYTADVIAHQGVLDEGVHFIQKPFSMRGLAIRVRGALTEK